MNDVIDRDKSHIRELQARLNERMRDTNATSQDARLGLMIGGERYLVELSEAGEIVSAATPITAVPLTRDWFRGLANLRGMLYAVVDLARFGGGESTPLTKESRLLALASRHNFNAALLITRMLGLQNVGSMKLVVRGGAAAGAAADSVEANEPFDAARPWLVRQLIDAEGRTWNELSLSRLILDERFVMVER